MEYRPVEKLDTNFELPSDPSARVSAEGQPMIDPTLPDGPRSFVRFYRGEISGASAQAPISQKKALGWLLHRPNVTDVGFVGPADTGPAIENRTMHAILRCAPSDAYACQIINTSTLKGLFRAKAQETAASPVYWIGKAEDYRATPALRTSAGQLVELDYDDKVFAMDGAQVWPKRSTVELRPLARYDQEAVTGSPWQYGRNVA